MDRLESFLQEHAKNKDLIINESTLNNYNLVGEFAEFEEQLTELQKQGKIKFEHQTFPGSTEEQIVVRWIG